MEYHLKALEKFACLSKDCPDSCCQGSWLIEIDENTIQKWQAMPDTSAREELFASVRTLDSGVRTFFRENGKCMHLSQQGLCTIQLKYGESALPEVCREYPRLTRWEGEKRLSSAKLSCPEIARLVLSEESGGEPFDWSGAHSAKLTGDFQPITSEQFNNQFDLLVADILNQKKTWLTNRLYYIVSILCELQLCNNDQSAKISILKSVTKNIKADLYQVNLALKKAKPVSDPRIVASVWVSVFNLCMQSDYFRKQDWVTNTETYAYMDSVNKANFANESLEALNRKIKEILVVARPVMRQKLTGILERYLKVSFRNKGFPWLPVNNDHAATFLNAIVPLSMINLLCWIRYENCGNLDCDFLVDVIWKIERDIGQSNVVYEHLFANPHMLDLKEYKEFFTHLC